MPKPPQDIYARHLSSPRGYPLWTPEPTNELLAYRRDGLRIGDVGVVIPEDGCFDVFFNICLSKNHPFHQATGVPDNFEPIELGDVDIRTVINAENPGRIITSSSVKGVRTVERSGDSSSRGRSPRLEYGFNLSSSEGALLILPEGAQRHDLRNHHRFLEAATQHGSDWYRFAEERVGQIIGHDSLYLITGLCKTSSWSLAAFEKTAGTAEYPAQFKVSQVGADNFAAAYTWDTTRALDWRVGPIDSLGIPNQAVFIRGFKIARRTGMFGARWISVKADVPSTRPNPAKSIGAVPGDSWLGYLFGGPSIGRTTEPSGSGTQDEVAADSALDAARDEIENNGALAVGEHVVIQRVPEASQAFHPSDIINRYLLNKEPSANIAITHDDDWITILEENLLQTEDLAQEGRLEALVSQKYDVISEQVAVYLQRQRNSDPGTSDDADKAGTSYARSVQRGNPLPRNQLPDAGLVFDTLLRRDEFRKHPTGLSALMFSFATLVIHSVFRNDHKNVNINMTFGRVDLTPLYGNDQATQDKIRIKDGRGCLHPDAFAEDRLLLLPPATAVILVLFNRNHNYIARRLLEINERGTWVDPFTLPFNSPKLLLKQEEEIFQIARLCNCAWFAAVVSSDYFSAILGLVRRGSSWSLEPFGDIRSDHQLFERGRGNARSVEFDLLYRWHATTSLEDEKWIERQFEQFFPGKDPEQVTVADFYRKEAALEASEPGVEQWFGVLQRQEDGTFKDSDLANILQNSTSYHAAAFGARGTPGIMKINEIMGIESHRAWGVCSLNDFRKFLGLKTYSSFEEWNPDKKVAAAAEKVYGHIDNLELYVGLQAEDTKPVIEGAGLCPGHTISCAIFSDAIVLTRRDRLFTDDFTPHNLTSWGFADCQRDPNGWGFGSTLGRLFLRTLPNDYNEKSVYTWFPFIHPEAMEKYLKDLDKLDDYSLERPKKHVPSTTVSGYVEVGEVLRDVQSFAAVSEQRASEVVKGRGFFSASSDAVQEQKEFISALAPSPEGIEKIEQYFYKKTAELVSTASYWLIDPNTKSVNIVGDVLKLVPVYWAASEIAGIPLKDKLNPSGVYTPQQLYNILGEIYQFIFLDVEPGKYMVLRQKVQGYVEELSHHIKASFGATGFRISVAGTFGTIFGRKKTYHNEFLKRLFELGHSNEQVVNEILALLVGMTVEVSLALTNVVNLLLDSEEHATFRTQAKSVDSRDPTGLEAYVMEALRIDPPFAGVSYIAKKDHTVGSLAVQKGERVYLDVAGAGMSEEAFPNPTTFDATRTPRERYLRADVALNVVGADIAPKITVQVLRSILSLDNVRRGPGQSGKLQRFQDSSFKDLRYVYLDAQQFRSPWPTSLVILYDAPSPTA